LKKGFISAESDSFVILAQFGGALQSAGEASSCSTKQFVQNTCVRTIF